MLIGWNSIISHALDLVVFMRIAIVDYELGNLGSIENMIKKIGHQALITRKHEDILNADKIILPGVGAFDNGMKNLQNYNLVNVLNEAKEKNTHILGICLGMQLMTNSSEEGNLKGLGWINAEVKGFSFHDRVLKVPHMGWNIVKPAKASAIFSGFKEEVRAYFVHSYFAVCKNDNDVLSTTEYGAEFASAFLYNNVVGMQFHPEKSHKFGMQLLHNFLDM